MITLSYMDILICIFIVVFIVLVIYAIIAVKKLLPVIDNLKKLTEDALVLTDKAKNAADKAGTVVVEVSDSLNDVCGLLNNNKNKVSAFTNLTNATAALVKIFKK